MEAARPAMPCARVGSSGCDALFGTADVGDSPLRIDAVGLVRASVRSDAVEGLGLERPLLGESTISSRQPCSLRYISSSRPD
eukprot:1351732-Prymnesium_polylepis.1